VCVTTICRFDLDLLLDNCIAFNGAEDDISVIAKVIHSKLCALFIDGDGAMHNNTFIPTQQSHAPAVVPAPARTTRPSAGRTSASTAPLEAAPVPAPAPTHVHVPVPAPAPVSSSGTRVRIRRSLPPLDAHLKEKLMLLLTSLRRNRKLGWFLSPVDAVALPDYLTIVAQPMDIGTLEEMVEGGNIHTLAEFASTLALIWKNALFYNPEGEVTEAARVCKQVSMTKLQDIAEEVGVTLPANWHA
jgi:hypothetical protein